MTMRMRVAVAVLGLAAVITSGCSQLSGDEPIDREPAAAVEVDEAPSAPELSAEPEQAEASSAPEISAEPEQSEAETLTMPSVIGTNLQVSYDELTDRGFTDVVPLPVDGHAFAANYRNWIVVGQDPAAGAKVKSDRAITLEVEKTDAAESRSCLDLDC